MLEQYSESEILEIIKKIADEIINLSGSSDKIFIPESLPDSVCDDPSRIMLDWNDEKYATKLACSAEGRDVHGDTLIVSISIDDNAKVSEIEVWNPRSSLQSLPVEGSMFLSDANHL